MRTRARVTFLRAYQIRSLVSTMDAVEARLASTRALEVARIRRELTDAENNARRRFEEVGYLLEIIFLWYHVFRSTRPLSDRMLELCIHKVCH